MLGMTLDFGYPWWLSYGHLTLAMATGCVFAIGWFRRWSRVALIPLGLLTLWAGTVFPLMRFGVNINSVARMPAPNFLQSLPERQLKVLDIGAGTGRSTIMLLSARPNASVVALDLFGESFDSHFGHSHEDARDRLQANLKAAGVDQRASIVKSDMRTLPFEEASFDGIVSAYAVDHLDRDGIKRTLAESARVLKPGGEFLLILVNGRDPWLRMAFGPMLAHGGFRGADWWTSRMREAGYLIVETGNSPGTFHVVGKKPGAAQ